MKVLNKTEQIAHSEGQSINTAIQCMLMGYVNTASSDGISIVYVKERKNKTRLYVFFKRR